MYILEPVYSFYSSWKDAWYFESVEDAKEWADNKYGKHIWQEKSPDFWTTVAVSPEISLLTIKKIIPENKKV